MNNDSPARPPKVAIYDRPASADHRSLSWLAVIVAMVSGVGWLIYWYWTR